MSSEEGDGPDTERSGTDGANRRTATLSTPARRPSTVVDDVAGEIVEAAVRCFSRWGIPRTRVEDIATEAGISRPHIYRYFSSKDALVHAVVLRQIRRHHRRLAERLPIEGPAADLIVNTLASGIRESVGDSEVKFLIHSESANMTARSLTASPEVVAELRAHWKPLLEYARDRAELRDCIDPDAASRWLVFLQFSYLALPEMTPTRPELEKELRAFVVPALLDSRRC